MSVFGGRVRLHGFQCSAQLLRLKRAGAVRGRALQLFQQGNGSEAVQAAAVDQLHARCGKNGKDLDLRCIQLGQKRRKSCLLRGLIRQGRVDRLGRLIQLLCPVGGFSVIGKGTAITITFQADDTMLRDEHERKIGFGLAVRKLAGHDDVPVIFAHQLHQRGNELQNVLLGAVAGRGGHRCTSSFFRGQLPQNIASLTPQGQITVFLFPVQSRQGKNNKDGQNDQCNCILCHLDTS